MSSPSLTLNGVRLSIALIDKGEDAVVERWTQDGPSADVWFQCRYADRYAAILGLRGGVVRTTVGGKKSFNYVRPATYPPSPNLFCTSVGDTKGIKARTDPAGWVVYDTVLIPAHFSVPTWDAFGGTITDASGLPMTTTNYRTSAEIFAPPGSAYKYSSGSFSGKPVAESSVGIVRPRVEIAMTRHLIPYPYLDGIMARVGYVNNFTMDFGDHAFPRGCLMFAGCDTQQSPNPVDGDMAWDYTFTFLGNYQVEWNEFMGPDGEWAYIADAAGDPPFKYVDFSPFFASTF